MARRSEQDEIAEALADMPKWRAKTARSFLGYALLIGIMTVLLLAEMWLFRNKMISKFSTNPIRAILMISGNVWVVYMCVKAIGLLLSARNGLTNSNSPNGKLTQG